MWDSTDLSTLLPFLREVVIRLGVRSVVTPSGLGCGRPCHEKTAGEEGMTEEVPGRTFRTVPDG